MMIREDIIVDSIRKMLDLKYKPFIKQRTSNDFELYIDTSDSSISVLVCKFTCFESLQSIIDKSCIFYAGFSAGIMYAQV